MPYINNSESYLSQQFAIPRLITRIVGIVISLISLVVIISVVSSQSHKVPILAFGAPAFMMLGLSLVIKPINKPEMEYLYGATKLPWRYIPSITKACLILGSIMSFVMVLLLTDF